MLGISCQDVLTGADKTKRLGRGEMADLDNGWTGVGEPAPQAPPWPAAPSWLPAPAGSDAGPPAGAWGSAPHYPTLPPPPPASPGGSDYPPGYPSAPFMSRPTTVCGFAVASLVLGIVWVFWVGSVLAVIFAFIALRQIRKANGALSGQGMAIAGMVLGWIGVGTLILVVLISLLGAVSVNRQLPDRAAESNLRNALTAALTAYVDSQNFSSDASSGVYASIEPSLTFTSNALTSQDIISVHSPSSDTIVLAAKSASGECFYIEDVTGAAGNDTAGFLYAKHAAPARGCDATDTVTFTSSW
jgi:hypothetical protein